MVRGSSRHLLALINDILDLSKIEAEQLEVESEPLDPCASARAVADLVRPLADKKGLALRVDAPPGLHRAVGDPRRVQQVLLNLLSNAIKFTERGEVGLAVSPGTTGEPPRIRFRVWDTGHGIAPEELPTLFQPFHQLDSGLSRKHEGTGLGLSISRKLARLMRGDLTAESEPGRGSAFTLTLPMEGAPSP